MQAKKILMVAAAVLSVGVACAQETTLVEARKKIVDSIANPAVMTATVKDLSAEDQRQYLADVVAAIGKMPGSHEEIAASYLSVCRAALKGSKKGNLAAMIAEVFATVPTAYLPIICESLGSDMLNRAANPSATYNDEEFLAIATNVMATVNERVGSEDGADVRSAFAALAFIRGANGASDKVLSTMIASLPESAQKPASQEWFPAALAEGDKKSYDPMLVAAPSEPDSEIPPEELPTLILRIPGPANSVPVIADIYGGGTDPSASSNEQTPVIDATKQEFSEFLPSLGTGAPSDSFVETVPESGTEEPTSGYKGQTP